MLPQATPRHRGSGYQKSLQKNQCLKRERASEFEIFDSTRRRQLIGGAVRTVTRHCGHWHHLTKNSVNRISPRAPSLHKIMRETPVPFGKRSLPKQSRHRFTFNAVPRWPMPQQQTGVELQKSACHHSSPSAFGTNAESPVDGRCTKWWRPQTCPQARAGRELPSSRPAPPWLRQVEVPAITCHHQQASLLLRTPIKAPNAGTAYRRFLEENTGETNLRDDAGEWAK